MHQNIELVLESCRTFTNLSRIPSVQGFENSKVCQIMTILLDHSEPAVVYETCGTIINLCVHNFGGIYRQIFIENDAITK